MNQKPLLSIIVPVYNVENYLHKCVDSLVNQTLKDLEIILVNDCSTDRSQEIIDEYVKKDSRIKSIIHEKNMGVGGARNSGLEVAKGEFIAFVDSDDWVELDAYQYLCALAEKEKMDIVAFGANFCTDQEKYSIRYPYLYLIENTLSKIENYLKRNIFCTVWSKIYHHELFKNRKNFFEKHFYEDEVFTFEILCESKRFLQIEQCFYNYYQRSDSITKEFSLKAVTDLGLCLDNLRLVFKKYQLETVFQKEFDDFLMDILIYNYRKIILHFNSNFSEPSFLKIIEKFGDLLDKQGTVAIHQYTYHLFTQNQDLQHRLDNIPKDLSEIYSNFFCRFFISLKKNGFKMTGLKILKKIQKKIKLQH